MENAKEFIEKACDELQSRDNKYTDIRTKVISYLEEMLKKPELGVAFIAGRNKGQTSLREKIYRKNYFNKYSDVKEFLDMLSDGIGIRIVCLLIENEKDILNYLSMKMPNKYTWNNEVFFYEEGKNVYINLNDQPQQQKNDFYIYRMDALWIDEKSTVRIEIQVKSLTHLLWGEVEHSLFYKNYDYVLSNDYYSNLMRSINIELENIDLQISTLQRHLEQNEANTNGEIRQIAGFILAKHFKKDICECVGCEIDLREVYDAYVDMEFLYEIEPKVCLLHLRDIESSIHDSKGIKEIYEKLNGREVDYTRISNNVKKIVETIDSKVKEGDIFWKAFISMYIALKNRDNTFDYSDELSNISKRFEKMVSPFKDNIDMFDDGINTLIRQYMMKAVIDTFSDKGQLGFFSIERKLRKMNEEINRCAVDVQNSIYHTIGSFVDREVLEANQEVIYEYFRLNYKRLLGEIISYNELERIFYAVENSEFQLDFKKNVFPYVLEQKNISKELLSQVKNLCWEEVNDGI